MNCSRCGSPLQAGWLACPKCGLQFSQAVPPSPQDPFQPQEGYSAQGPVVTPKASPLQNGCMISALILFCFPLGLVFLWINPRYSAKFKSIVTGALALLVMVSVIYNASPAGQRQQAMEAQQEAAQQAAQQKADLVEQQQEMAQKKRQAEANAQAAKAKYEALQRVSVDTLSSAYSANEIAANKSYDNTEFVLTGTVGDIRTAIGGQSYVSLQGATPPDSLTPNEVTCYFSDDLSDQLAALNKGDHISVDGTCGGEPIGIVVMKDCKIVH